MEVEIRSVAHIKEFLGSRSFVYRFEGSMTAFGLLERLDAEYGLGKLIYNEDKSLQDDVRVLLRGRDIRFLAPELLDLANGDIVLIIPTLAGG